MRPTGQKRDAHIRDGCTGQNTRMLLLLYVSKDQSLPVAVKLILAADAVNDDAAAARQRDRAFEQLPGGRA